MSLPLQILQRFLLQIIANFYFPFVNLIFNLVNYFRPKVSVDWAINDPLLLLSAKEAAEKIRSNQITSTQLLNAYIARIKLVNPVINAVERDNFAMALKAAEQVDEFLESVVKSSEEFKDLAKAKPLLGVPFTCKGNLMVNGLATLCGNPKFVANPPSDSDAEVIRRMQSAGAILIATTNLPKMAESWGDSENTVFGRTNNPYDVRLTPGGSSGGEAALIASAGSIFGLGNDIGASVRIPAAFCGVYGLRATPNLVPLDGLIGLFGDEGKSEKKKESIWVNGPICRYAEDLPLVFKVLIGEEKANALKIDDKMVLKKIRVFYFEDLNVAFCERLCAHPRMALQRALNCFESNFGMPARKVDFRLADQVFEMWAASSYGMPDRLVPNFSTAFMEAWKYLLGRSECTHLQIALPLLAAIISPKDEDERQKVLDQRDLLRDQILELLGDDGILLCPIFPTATPFHGMPKFSEFNFAYTLLFSTLRLPALACPVGTTRDGLPIGVQIIGSINSERLLFTAAKVLEEGLGGWTPGRNI